MTKKKKHVMIDGKFEDKRKERKKTEERKEEKKDANNLFVEKGKERKIGKKNTEKEK